jgi:response regulator RpfG family c-di-GMP phosphodiesterase
MNALPTTPETPSKRTTILCVDDEPSILSSLRRLFRSRGFQVLTAESGAAGLSILESETADLVISDMRMPEMDGVVFLEHVRQRWPDTIRLLLTGYADITSIMGAINRGEIYRYIAKPWDDNDIFLTVQAAIDRSELEREKKRLEALVLQQNEELKNLNAGLEAKVEARTRELKQSNLALAGANEHLKNHLITSIKMFTALIELRDPKLAGHSRKVADLSRRIAQALNVENKQVQDLFVAGLLHGIGKVGFDDNLLKVPVATMTPRQLEAYRKHPAHAEQLLMPLSELKAAVEIIGSQLERHDGSGYPRGIAGRKIPICARILALAIDFTSLQIGLIYPQQLSIAQAHAEILRQRGHHYDPDVVDALTSTIGLLAEAAQTQEPNAARVVMSSDLKAGMVLSRDLHSPSGMLLLTAGHVLDDAVIEKIINFGRSIGWQVAAEILPPGSTSERET